MNHANTFYTTVCNLDAKMSPYPGDFSTIKVDEGGEYGDLKFYKSQMLAPQAIMNDNVAINYRTIYNGFPEPGQANFTEYDDYIKCMRSNEVMKSFYADIKNPTYANILKYYNDDFVDPYGVAAYKMQDFIYLKYYNQIPNNYMVTLRRYTKPCQDYMFGVGMPIEFINDMNNNPTGYFAIATAVTYMGEQTGNKLSDILKFDYGANWDKKNGKLESLKNTDGGLAAQMKKWGVNEGTMAGETGLRAMREQGSTAFVKDVALMTLGSAGKGKSINEIFESQHRADADEFSQRYGEAFYGDLNVVQDVLLRSRGLTYSNNFTLTFEYSLKSLKCVNPKVAMLDILSNFLVLTGNYGNFWGGETVFYGQKSIAPQYGDPNLMRQGKIKEYAESVKTQMFEGLQKMFDSDGDNKADLKGFGKGLWNLGKNFLGGLLGNLLGGSIGVVGETQVMPALLSGQPTGFWHVTIGNPLNPIAVMGNMAVKSTKVEFGDVLGYDDFPTEIKFIVELEHCMPRDNGKIQSMFNAGKGRIYSFTDGTIEAMYHNGAKAASMGAFQSPEEQTANQSTNIAYDPNTGSVSNTRAKILGGNK